MKNIFTKGFAAAVGVMTAAASVFGMGTASTYAAENIAHTKSIEGSGDDYTLKLTVTGKDKKDESTITTTTNGHADILLVLDRTGSMSSSLGDGTRLQALQTAAKSFVSGLKDDEASNISVVTFGMTDNEGKTPVDVAQGWTTVSSVSKANINNIINGMTLHNPNNAYNTTYYPGLSKADEQLTQVSNTGNNKYVIFFSDGENSDSSYGYNLSGMATTVKSKATVFTLGIPVADPWGGMFGGSASTDPADLKNMASSADKYYSINDANAMSNAFTQALQVIKEETTITSTPMTNVTITDVLSDYVEQNGDITVSGNSGKVTAQSVNGKNISVTLDTIPDGETVTVSIPVKPSQAAKDAADAAGNTDSTFKTNKGATLKFFYKAQEQNLDYAEEPQITLTGTQHNDPATKPSDISFKLSKVLEVKAGDKTVPDATFKFTAVSNDADAPAITIDDVTFTSADTLNSENKVSKEISFALPEAAAFTKAGTYTYTITETADTYTGDGFMTYDDASYTLTVKVCETAQGMTYDDGNGTHIVLANADGDKVSGLEFNNEYDKDVEETTLVVSKTVEGDHANKNQEFEYTISFTDPGNAKDVKPARGTESIEFGTDYTFKLKDGETAEFSLPVGTKYTIVETGADSYEAKAVITCGDTQDTKSAGVGADLTVSDVTAVNGVNKADFTNTYVDNPLTGLANGKGPLFIIIPIAAGAVVLLAVANKRRARR